MSHDQRLTRNWQWLLGLTLALVVSCWTWQPVAAQDSWPHAQPLDQASLPADTHDGAGADYMPGQVLVVHRADALHAADLLATLNAEVIALLAVRGVQATMPNTPIIGKILAVPVGREWDIIATLQTDPAVVYAEPNWIVSAADDSVVDGIVVDDSMTANNAQADAETPFTINDSLYLDRQWYLQRINASRAWQLADEYGDLGDSIRVAIIDSGVQRDHPEFGGRVLPVKSFVVDGSLNDDCGHGTHVAGLVGAAFNNGPGTAGVAPDVEIDPYRALAYSSTTQRCTGTVAAVATAIYTAIDNNVDIINLSLTMTTLDNTLYAAIIAAHNDGVLLIAAAGNCPGGNSDCAVMYPAALDEVIGVAATGYTNEYAGYNTRGDRIDFAAPGGTTLSQLYSTWPRDIAAQCTNGYQLINNGGYCNAIGTSSATGLVTGAAALAWDIDRDLSADQVRQILRDTVMPYDSPQPNTGAGLLDAAAALRKVLTPVLETSTNEFTFTRTPGAAAFEAGLRLSNPSGASMGWELNLPTDQNWLTLTGLDNSSISGSVAYGQPAHVSLTISPTNLAPGIYATHIEVVGIHAGNRQVQHVRVQLAVYDRGHWIFMPLIANGSALPGIDLFAWATPDANGRVVRNVSDISTATANLPFDYPFGDDAYDDIRIYADGFITMPKNDTGTVGANRCFPSALWPDQAIYGWWTDLDPKADGAQVSTFTTDDSDYVIEYADVPVRIDGAAAYRVSFQIVLRSDGQIRLNYLDAPDLIDAAPQATVGVEALDGRLYNRAYCVDNGVEIGIAPHSYQSIVIPPGGAF